MVVAVVHFRQNWYCCCNYCSAVVVACYGCIHDKP